MKCSICGHVYDPVLGDKDAPAGTDFQSLPEGWVCPVCLAAKPLLGRSKSGNNLHNFTFFHYGNFSTTFRHYKSNGISNSR